MLRKQYMYVYVCKGKSEEEKLYKYSLKMMFQKCINLCIKTSRATLKLISSALSIL